MHSGWVTAHASARTLAGQLELRDGARLLLETAAPRVVGSELGREYLERHGHGMYPRSKVSDGIGDLPDCFPSAGSSGVPA